MESSIQAGSPRSEFLEGLICMRVMSTESNSAGAEGGRLGGVGGAAEDRRPRWQLADGRLEESRRPRAHSDAEEGCGRHLYCLC